MGEEDESYYIIIICRLDTSLLHSQHNYYKQTYNYDNEMTLHDHQLTLQLIDDCL